MHILQETFDSESFKRLKIETISRRIRGEGYSLTDEQLAAIEEHITAASDDVLTIDLPGYENADVQISIEEADVARVLEEYTEKLSDERPKIIESTSELVLTSLTS